MTLAAALLVSVTTRPRQVTLDTFLNEQLVGFTTMSVEVLPNGNVRKAVSGVTRFEDATRSMTYEVISDRKGRPIRETEIDTLGVTVKVVMETGRKSLAIKVAMGQSKQSTKVPIPAGNISDISGVWFITQRPKVGESVTCWHYRLLEMQWKKETTTYCGYGKIPGSNLVGHHIQSSDSDSWIDDSGLPIRTESKLDNDIPMVLVRR